MNDYLKVVYNEQSHPYTEYPGKLCHYLYQTFHMNPGMKLLEPGCGRCEILNHFKNLGLDTYGVDLSPEAPLYTPDIPITVCDLEHEPLPYPDNQFDVIYSKSFLEHFYFPERFIKEAYRVLKSGGLLLNLVPDWDTQYRTYFDDYTHRTPFTKVSISDLYKIHGFSDVNVFKLRQLPIVWRHPLLNHFCSMIAPFTPIRSEVPLFKWSRLLMLVSSARKPHLDSKI